LDLFSETAAGICEGQQLDMEFEQRTDVTEAEYITMIRLKTAILLGAGLMSGAIIGDAGKTDQQHLYDFGINLGLAFQIQDDWLDVYGDPTIFGKKIGGDIICNKKTYLWVQAWNLSDEKGKNKLYSYLNTTFNDSEKIQAVTQIYNQLHIKEKARDQIEFYFQQAIQSLQAVNVDSEKKAVLMCLAAELMNRES
jgi:geranylgeranyl diphosphate synthase type II